MTLTRTEGAGAPTFLCLRRCVTKARPRNSVWRGLSSVEISSPAAAAQKPPRALPCRGGRVSGRPGQSHQKPALPLPAGGPSRQASLQMAPPSDGVCSSFSFPLLPVWEEPSGCSRVASFGSDDLQRDFREEGPGLGAWEAGPGLPGLWGEPSASPAFLDGRTSVLERSASSLPGRAGRASRARTEARLLPAAAGCSTGSGAGRLAGRPRGPGGRSWITARRAVPSWALCFPLHVALRMA